MEARIFTLETRFQCKFFTRLGCAIAIFVPASEGGLVEARPPVVYGQPTSQSELVYCSIMTAPGFSISQPLDRVPPVISEAFLSILRSYDVTAAWVFGSTVSGSNRPDSDIDLLVTFGNPVTLFEQIDLAEELTRLTGRRIDLMTAIHPAFEPYIRPTLVPLPL
jgi:predicted nucleotidyltransferase